MVTPRSFIQDWRTDYLQVRWGDLSQANLEQALKWMNALQKWLDSHRGEVKIWRKGIYVLRDLVNYAKAPPPYMWISAFRDTPLENVPYPAIWAGHYENERVVLKEVTMNKAAGKVFWREAIAWRQFHHPNILPFRGIAQHPDRLDGYYLVSPYLQNMTLSSYINKPHGGYHAATQRRILITQIADALVYLHALKIVHGDIKNSNVLIDDRGNAVLCDFGLTIIGDETQGSFTTTRSTRASPGWSSPEHYLDAAARRRPGVDVFAFACLCYMICTGRAPFESPEYNRLWVAVHHERRRRPQPNRCLQWIPVPSALWNVIDGCWSDHQDRRWSMEEALPVIRNSVDNAPDGIYQVLFIAVAMAQTLVSHRKDILTVYANERVAVLGKHKSFWQIRNEDGLIGYAPAEWFPNAILVQVTMQQKYAAPRTPELFLSHVQGEVLDILQYGTETWFARNSRNEEGYIYSKWARPRWDTTWRSLKLPGTSVLVKRAYKVQHPHHIRMSSKPAYVRLYQTTPCRQFSVVCDEQKQVLGLIPHGLLNIVEPSGWSGHLYDEPYSTK